jgi:DNA repair protein RecO (recombination protein O)
MHWTDEAIILATRRHGETSLILELMTPGHGRHLGLVRGGRSRRQQPFLQAGNSLTATWRARLHDHLGNYTVEPVTERASRLMESRGGLYGLQVLTALLRLLPERDPHPRLYTALLAILDALDDPLLAGELIVRFEIEVLNDLGFGLDLASCAATGRNDDLAYVSPKSGRAVSLSAGEPYRDRLLVLPRFLLQRDEHAPAASDLLDAFRLTGFFLARHVYEPRGVEPPAARATLLGMIAGDPRPAHPPAGRLSRGVAAATQRGWEND